MELLQVSELLKIVGAGLFTDWCPSGRPVNSTEALKLLVIAVQKIHVVRKWKNLNRWCIVLKL